MNFSFLKFRDRQEAEVEVYTTWEVRWMARYGGFSGETRPEVRVFKTKDDAEEFAAALRDAYALLKHTHGTHVSVEPLRL